jgi:hypothetical protein
VPNKITGSTGEKIAGIFEDALGLPPGDATPHGRGKPAKDLNVPHGTLTAEDSPKADEALADREEGRDRRRPSWSSNS